MSFLFGLKEKEELNLIFDIRSSSVGATLFLKNEKSIPKIIFTIREPILVEEQVNFERFLSSTIKALDIVSSRVSTSGKGVPKNVFCVLSSPWYGSETRTIVYKKNTPFVFTAKLGDELVKKEIKIFEEEYLKKYEHTSEKIKPIEFKNLKTSLNGYAVSSPFNQKTKDLEIIMFISMGEEKVLNSIEETINKHLHVKSINFSSFLLNSFAVARDIFVHHEDFLLVDVGGEITDVSMIKKDILRSTISFPMGKNSVLRKVASKINSSLTEAASMISLFKDGHAGESIKNKAEPAIEDIRKEWLAEFQKSLVNISNDISLPSVVFVTVDEDIAQFFTDTIKKEEFSQYTLTDSKFKVVFLSHQAMHGIVSYSDGTTQDPFFTMEAIYINRFFKKYA